jgi:alpha-glucosidase
MRNDRDVTLEKYANFIAAFNNAANLPWRVMMIEDNAAGLLTNQLVYQLASPAVGDFCW